MRGLPGSQRDHIAYLLFNSLQTAIVSIDNWFIRENKGRFDTHLLKSASAACWDEYKGLIDQGLDIVVNNVNSKYHHYQHYVDTAVRNGYEVAIVSIPHPDVKEASKKSGIGEKYLRKIMLEWEEK